MGGHHRPGGPNSSRKTAPECERVRGAWGRTGRRGGTSWKVKGFRGPSRRGAGSMSSHHPPPIPQPRQGGWVRQVRSAWSLGCSPQAKSWALTSELKQGRWGRAHPGWTEGQGQHVRSGGKHAGLLWGWTGAASPPMSFTLCPAQGSLSMGWGSPAAHASRAAQLQGVTAVRCQGDTVGHPLNPHPGGPSPSEACCSAQQGPQAPPEWGKPCSQIPSSLGCGAGTEHPMQHRGPRDHLVTATPGSFCRGCMAWEQAEVGPCTKASSLFPRLSSQGEQRVCGRGE